MSLEAPPSTPAASAQGAVLVCGLGVFGAQCAEVLRSYEVPVRALDQRALASADVPCAQGDCRDLEALLRAGITECRAVILATGDARANVEGAMVARKAMPSIRIVARTTEHSLNELLTNLLGNFAAYEPSRLAAGAFALAALGADILGQFRIEGRLLRVMRERIAPGDPRVGQTTERASGHGAVLLAHTPAANAGATPPVDLFHRFDPAARIAPGDTLVVLSLEGAPDRVESPGAHDPRFAAMLARVKEWLSMGRRSAVVAGAAIAVSVAVIASVVVFPLFDPSLSRGDAFFTAAVLMTGGTYADLFPPFHHLSNALRFFSVALSILGTVAVGLVYAWLTDQLMKMRLRIAPRRPSVPREGHVVVVGLGRVGRPASALLQELGRSVAAIEASTVDEHVLPKLPVVVGDATERGCLDASGVANARGVLAATDSDWVNLEVALLARTLNPDCALVMRTSDTRFSTNVAGILPRLRVLCVPVIAAKAFAAAALGENVLDLFQLDERTVFVIEYHVEAQDGLDGRLLADVAEGYSVVPVLHQTRGHAPRFWSPIDQATRVSEGDRLILLGPSRSLQRIERGSMRTRTTSVTLRALRPYADRIAAAAVLAQHLSYPLEQARALLERVPSPLPERVYPHQAHRLRDALEAAGVDVTLETDEMHGASTSV